MIIEPMISLIGIDSYTTFGDEILKGKHKSRSNEWRKMLSFISLYFDTTE